LGLQAFHHKKCPDVSTQAFDDLFKTPNGTNIVCVVLIVVVLIAIVEVLFPGVVGTVLGRTPIVGSSKTANP